MAYRPALQSGQTHQLGTWTAPGLPDREAVLTCDPRIWSWLINAAVKRTDLHYSLAFGTPHLSIQLS